MRPIRWIGFTALCAFNSYERYRAPASIAEVIDSSLTVYFLTLTRLFWPSVSPKPPDHNVLSMGRNFFVLEQNVHERAGCYRDGGKPLSAAQVLGQPSRSLAGINIESSGGPAPCSIVAGTPSKRLGMDTTACSCIVYSVQHIMTSPATVNCDLQFM
ncbi:hypothetical protein BU25DRAFT_128066 [Macroventuria anomochaeta]|uniref:Uncharacterized protein n=1 Tax=Macroventuria anomochaeta TaxID=301207 RepID=A0ACB6RSZ0_9PLEO|nr:uncharacterized protein BU25DRAFT_128066 [Macroventuria anomochaeta]KAF2624889.1 hypothetical protein BU25DRAFT_128066 [Macroventuria anomochaeta]